MYIYTVVKISVAKTWKFKKRKKEKEKKSEMSEKKNKYVKGLKKNESRLFPLS